MSLNLRQMELLRAVMVTGNLTKAAQRLDVSQPAVSRMLKHMEDRLGVSLFVREHGRLSPTPEALELNDQVERVFLNVRGVQRLSLALRKGTDHIVRIGVPPSLTGFLTEPIAETVAAHPDTRVVVKIMEPEPIETNVINGDYHLGLAQTVMRTAELSVVDLGQIRPVCVLPATHRLASRTVIAPNDLAGETLILVAQNTPDGGAPEKLLGDAAATLRVGLESNSSYHACEMVEAGIGVAVTDPFAIDEFPAGRVAFRAFAAPAEAGPRIIHAQGRALPRIERGLIEQMSVSARKRLDALKKTLPGLDATTPSGNSGRRDGAARSAAG